MKIEKINDNQIKCTLTSQDLADRSIDNGELVYGSDKAKQLFRDMMLEANRRFGFRAGDNIPIMIEAIPEAEHALTLIITRVDDPAELDNRFSKFSPTSIKADEGMDWSVEGADDMIDVFHRLLDAKKAGTKAKKGMPADSAPRSAGKTKAEPVQLLRLFRFMDLDSVIAGSRALRGFFKSASSLYRIRKSGQYLLALHQGSHTPEDFNRVCNTLSEYGIGEALTAAGEAHLREHEEIVVEGNAVEKLGEL